MFCMFLFLNCFSVLFNQINLMYLTLWSCFIIYGPFMLIWAKPPMQHIPSEQQQPPNTDHIEQSPEPDQAWQLYKKTFDKTFSNPSEEREAREQFLQHWKSMRLHNSDYRSGKVPFKITCNEFADKSLTVLCKRNGFKKCPMRPVGIPTTFSSIGQRIPESLNYTKLGWATKVWDQGNCASCWAFAANAVIEGQIAKRHKFNGEPLLIKLSEQQLMDCSKPYGTHGCEGGDPAMAFHYLGDQGSMRESQYMYESRNGTAAFACRYNETGVLPFHVPQTFSETKLSFGFFKAGDVTSILIGLIRIGPLAASMNARNKNFFLYSDGVYKEDICDTNRLDHSVTIVGYGTDDRTGIDYWVIKNSWGIKWGMNGYGLIQRGVNMCGIEMDVTYTTLSEEHSPTGEDVKPVKNNAITLTADTVNSLKGSRRVM